MSVICQYVCWLFHSSTPHALIYRFGFRTYFAMADQLDAAPPLNPRQRVLLARFLEDGSGYLERVRGYEDIPVLRIVPFFLSFGGQGLIRVGWDQIGGFLIYLLEEYIPLVSPRTRG